MPDTQDGGATRKGNGKGKAKKSPAGKTGSKANGGRLTIKDRIRAGAKVHVGERGGLYIVYDGKKHPVNC